MKHEHIQKASETPFLGLPMWQKVTICVGVGLWLLISAVAGYAFIGL